MPSHSELETEVLKLRTWLENPRRGSGTKVVTKGHVLGPPFQISWEQSGNCAVMVVAASGQSLTLRFNRVVASPFRKGIRVIEFADDGILRQSTAFAPITLAHQKILEAFPPGSRFSSEELYSRVTTREGITQRHARRRWKELKYDYGFEVDWDSNENTYWRGLSEFPIRDPNPRPDDKKLREAFLPALAAAMGKDISQVLSCNYCGANVEFMGVTAEEEVADQIGLIDHRRPVFQGGDDVQRNLQVFCQTCNNKKNTVCRNCPYEHRCDSCIFAFPETVRAQRVVLILDRETIEGLGRKFGRDVEKRLSDLIRQLAMREGS